MNPQLSICIPAYNRPAWLERALLSIKNQHTDSLGTVEIVVSDDSTDPICSEVAHKILQTWNGASKYTHNSPPLGMAANWNQCIQLASGQYLLILHDDDYLLPKAIETILGTINLCNGKQQVFKFGVKVVDEQEKQIKKQCTNKNKKSSPSQAIQYLLTDSSWIRFPSLVVQRQAYLEVGDFRTDINGTADLEMWLRLLGTFGLMDIAKPICAYTIHAQALTQQMFTQSTIRQLSSIFEKAIMMDLLPLQSIDQCKAEFFHQFILAGTYRYIRLKDFKQARRILELFDSAELQELRHSRKWFLLRRAFSILMKSE